MDRRKVLGSMATAGIISLAGCLGNNNNGSNNDEKNNTDPGNDSTPGDSEEIQEIRNRIEEYAQLYGSDNVDEINSILTEDSPVNAEFFSGFDSRTVEEIENITVNPDEDVYGYTYGRIVDTVVEDLQDEQIAYAEVIYEEIDKQSYVLVDDDDGEWKVHFGYRYIPPVDERDTEFGEEITETKYIVDVVKNEEDEEITVTLAENLSEFGSGIFGETTIRSDSGALAPENYPDEKTFTVRYDPRNGDEIVIERITENGEAEVIYRQQTENMDVEN